MNVSEWIRQLEEEFRQSGIHFGHGTDNAGDEAAWLVLHAIGAALDGSFSDWTRPVNESDARAIRHLAERRVRENLPLAYLTGEAWFAGLAFHVNPDVLVPRSPLAELIRERFEPWVVSGRLGSVLDLCTGSGCIAVAIAVHMPTVKVDAVDISPAALAVAQRNVERHRVQDRVSLIESDLFQSLGGVEYDLIVANPPYVPADSVNELPAEYRAEPTLGLASGADGLDAPLQILAAAAGHLQAGGALLCEVGESEERLSRLLPAVPFTWLEFAHGGSGVFVLYREQLEQSAPAIAAVIEERKDVS